MVEFDVYKNGIKKLEDKANMMRDMHSYQFQKYEWISKFFSLTVIGLSAIVSILAVTDPDVLFLNEKHIDLFRSLIALLAFLIFLVSLGDKIYGINEKAAKHEQAVKVMTDFISECTNIRKLEIDSCSKEELKLKMDSLQSRYSLINQMNPFPVISDRDFIKGKQRHLIKVDVSQQLDKNRYEDVGEYVNRRYFSRFIKWIRGLLF